MTSSTTCAEVIQAIETAGLAHSVIALHSSLKSFGHLAGGAATVVRAFLNTGCTLVVPTFTYHTLVPSPPGWVLAQNGDDDFPQIEADDTVPFVSASPMIERSMGVIPAYILSLPGRVRSDHPLNSLAAIGPRAAEAIEAQGLLNVYGPYKKMYVWDNTYVLLMGVSLVRATPIHFAEERAGRRLFRCWARQADGAAVEIEIGSCSDGFDHLAPVVSAVETTVQVGDSRWRTFPFKPFVDTVTAAILQNPLITHCDDPDCVRCRDMVRGGPILA